MGVNRIHAKAGLHEQDTAKNGDEYQLQVQPSPMAGTANLWNPASSNVKLTQEKTFAHSPV
jgi:hypothetical protein